MTKSLYQDHFGIRENPFSIIPDPQYLYMSERHQEALAHLAYGISDHGGFVLLTGEVGTGKTTICRALIEHLPEDVDLGLILNPKLSEPELMASICDELSIAYPLRTTSLKTFFDLINDHLLQAHARGRNPVLMIDEAQNLSNPLIELIRLLTNLETSDKKLLQIILVGQPELNEILAQPSQRQTAQRITARYHLKPLALFECRNYIQHRMSIAGLETDVFSNAAVKSIFNSARGIPRLINSICDRSLLAAYVEGRKQVNKKLANTAAQEVFGTQALASGKSVWGSFFMVTALACALIWVALDPFKTGVKDTIISVTQQFLSIPQSDEWVSKPDPVARVKGTVLDAFMQSGTPDMAFQSLFSIWDQDFVSLVGVSPCDKAKSVGLSCAKGETTLAGLKAINRSMVTSLVMPDGEHVYGVLKSIVDDAKGSKITIAVGEREFIFDDEAFALRWPGDYFVVWKSSPYISRSLQFGLHGTDVQELRRLLALAGFGDGANDLLGSGSAFFGPGLRDQVRAFQSAVNLNPDGIVSAHTLLHITGVANTTATDLIHHKREGP